MRFVKAGLARLSEYRVTQEGHRVKLNQNESPYDLPEDIKRSVLKDLAKAGWNRYPPGEPFRLKEKLGDYADAAPEEILLGNGSNELIQALAQACCAPGDRIVTVDPGFAVYDRVARLLEADTLAVPLGEDFQFDLSAMVAAAEEAHLMFLASPHNPTGCALDVSDVGRIARSCRGILAVDEAYFEFSDMTALPLIRSRSNVVIFRTFSKAWRMAGLRLGYMLGPPDLVREIGKARLPFSVGLIQQSAGEAVLARRDRLLDRIAELVRERRHLFTALHRIAGIRVYPSRANFLLFECLDREAAELASGLERRGVAVRVFSHPRLRRALRVTVGTAAENREFLSSLRSALEEKSS